MDKHRQVESQKVTEQYLNIALYSQFERKALNSNEPILSNQTSVLPNADGQSFNSNDC